MKFSPIRDELSGDSIVVQLSISQWLPPLVFISKVGRSLKTGVTSERVFIAKPNEAVA